MMSHLNGCPPLIAVGSKRWEMRLPLRLLQSRRWENDSAWALFLSILLFAGAMLLLNIVFGR